MGMAYGANAQVPVTLEVDMTNVAEVSMNGVHVAGNFGEITAGLPIWEQDGLPMTATDAVYGGDFGIASWSLSVQVLE